MIPSRNRASIMPIQSIKIEFDCDIVNSFLYVCHLTTV